MKTEPLIPIGLKISEAREVKNRLGVAISDLPEEAPATFRTVFAKLNLGLALRSGSTWRRVLVTVELSRDELNDLSEWAERFVEGIGGDLDLNKAAFIKEVPLPMVSALGKLSVARL